MTIAFRDTALDPLAAERFYDENEAHIIHLEAIERFVPSVELVHRLGAHGIDWSAAANLGAEVVEIPVAFYQPDDDPDQVRFVLGDRGEPALVMPVTEIHNGKFVTVDLVAWPWDEPSAFFLCLGKGMFLGRDQITNPATYFLGKPLQVWRTPMRWLQAGCQGVVPLSDTAFSELATASRIAGEDVEHARELHRLVFDGVPIARERVFIAESGAAS
jgi:hypothetical protein